VKEWFENGSIFISHISGKTNLSDIFTKEMRAGSNFRHLCNSFMSHGSNFLRRIYNNLHPYSKPLGVPNLPLSQTLVAQRAQYILPSTPGILDVFILHPCFHLPSTISCLSSSGQISYLVLYHLLYAGHYELSYGG
jgi:hypothetical protein